MIASIHNKWLSLDLVKEQNWQQYVTESFEDLLDTTILLRDEEPIFEVDIKLSSEGNQRATLETIKDLFDLGVNISVDDMDIEIKGINFDNQIEKYRFPLGTSLESIHHTIQMKQEQGAIQCASLIQ